MSVIADELEQVARNELRKYLKSDKVAPLGDIARALALVWQIRQAERQFDLFRKEETEQPVTKVQIEVVDAS